MPQKKINIAFKNESPSKRLKVVAEPEGSEQPKPTKKKSSSVLKKALNLPLPSHYEELRKQFTILNTTGGFLQSKGVLVTSNRLQGMGMSFTSQELCQMAELAPLAVTLTRAADGDIQCEFLNCGKQTAPGPTGPLATKRATARRENYFRVRLEEETEKWACETLGRKEVRQGARWVAGLELDAAPPIKQLDIPTEAASTPMKPPREDDPEEEAAMEARCEACRKRERMDVREFLRHLATLPGYAGQMSSTHEASRAGHTRPTLSRLGRTNVTLHWAGRCLGGRLCSHQRASSTSLPRSPRRCGCGASPSSIRTRCLETPSRHILPSDVLSVGRGRRGGGSWSACGGHHGDCLGQVPLLLYSDRRRHRQR